MNCAGCEYERETGNMIENQLGHDCLWGQAWEKLQSEGNQAWEKLQGEENSETQSLKRKRVEDAEQQCVGCLWEKLNDCPAPNQQMHDQCKNSKKAKKNENLENVQTPGYPLGNDVFVSTSFFKSQVKVHIRQYRRENNNIYKPTKTGVAMKPRTWIKFVEILEGPKNGDCQLMFGESVTFTEEDGGVKRLHNQRAEIPLSSTQFEALRQSCETVTKTLSILLLDRLLSLHLFVARKSYPRTVATESAIGDAIQHALYNAVRNDMFSVFRCPRGCDNGCDPLYNCDNLTNRRLFTLFGPKAICYMDFKHFAEKFCSEHPDLLGFKAKMFKGQDIFDALMFSYDCVYEQDNIDYLFDMCK